MGKVFGVKPYDAGFYSRFKNGKISEKEIEKECFIAPDHSLTLKPRVVFNYVNGKSRVEYFNTYEQARIVYANAVWNRKFLELLK